MLVRSSRSWLRSVIRSIQCRFRVLDDYSPIWAKLWTGSNATNSIIVARCVAALIGESIAASDWCGAVHDHCGIGRFGDRNIADFGDGVEFPDIAAIAFLDAMDTQLIARNNRPAE